MDEDDDGYVNTIPQMTYEEYEKKVLKISEMDLKDMKKFITTPPPEGRIIQVSIIRDRSGIKNRFYPKYLIVFSENINHYIMSAKKKSRNKSTNIVLSLDKNDFNWKSENCIGKLKSNFVGTEFHIYDAGENPKVKSRYTEPLRKELGYIEYEKNIFGMKGPRKLRVTTPKYTNNNY